MLNNIKFVSVDLQRDFASDGGVWKSKGESIDFLQSILLPFLSSCHYQISEIISDYRLPRNGKSIESCNPYTEGFQSIIPEELSFRDPWVKCMHNPTWIRRNIGKRRNNIGSPYQNPNKFNRWLKRHIGLPSEKKMVVVIGLTTEVCVISTIQELYFRGYKVFLLYEGTDMMNKSLAYKDLFIEHSAFDLYAKVIYFSDLKALIGKSKGQLNESIN